MTDLWVTSTWPPCRCPRCLPALERIETDMARQARDRMARWQALEAGQADTQADTDN